MTQIAPRKFYDEMDNYYEIKKALKRKRYKTSFEFLHNYFFNEHKPWITPTILRESLCISDRGEAYQILSSLHVLNLLRKKKVETCYRKILYFPANETWWHMFKKELEKKKKS